MILKKIERDPNLSKEEKEVKKQQAIKPIVRSKSDKTTTEKPKSSTTTSKTTIEKPKSSIETKESEPIKKKYKYIPPYYNITQIRMTLFEDYGKVKIDEILSYFKDDLNVDLIMHEKEKMDKVKFKSVNEYCNILKDKYYLTKELTPEELSELVDKSIKHFQTINEDIKKVEDYNNKAISDMKKHFNKLNKVENNKNLTLYFQTLNKYISLSQQYIQLLTQVMGFIGNNLKPIEVNE